MILTTSLKIWTLITHFFILIGLGHGILTLGMGELFWLSTLFNKQEYEGGNGHVLLSTLQMVAVMCIVGQFATILSIFRGRTTASKWMHISGLCLLWASVITYAYGIRNDHYAHLSVLFCLPFVYCTIRTLIGRHIQMLWQKIDERI